MIAAAINKEFKLVFRDRHSLFVLFVMPAIFILIMSLALQEQFSGTDTPNIEVLFYDEAQSIVSEQFIQNLSAANAFNMQPLDERSYPTNLISTLGDDYNAFLYIPANFDSLIQGQIDSATIELSFLPNISAAIRMFIESSIQQSIMSTQINSLSQTLPALGSLLEGDSGNLLEVVYLYGDTTSSESPSSVQQNVPAWLIFSMFFVVIPISTTLLTEKQQGTLVRLKTMHISLASFLFAKSLPYLLINQLQLIIMLCIGSFLIPLLSDERLIIGSNYFSLAVMSLAVGIAALGYALFIAVIAKTIEQATTIGGVGNILFGAIGGIMVPKFVMPDYLQDFTLLSPMSWALDGFLEIFLYDSKISALIPEIGALLVFGITMFFISLLILTRSYRS